MLSLKIAISILMLIIGVVTEYLALKQKNDTESKLRKKLFGWLLILGAFLTGFFTIISLEIPAPEIYTTQGDSGDNNTIYVKCDWPLQVWYTLEPYD